MRITIILGPFLPVPPMLGGAVEKVHLLLAELYAAAGHDVAVISRRYENFATDEIVNGVRHIRVAAFNRTASLLINLLLDLCYAARVRRVLGASDITVTNSFSLPLLLPRRKAGNIYVHVARFPKWQMHLYFRAARLQAISQAVAAAIARQAPWLRSRIVTIGYPVPDRYFHAGGSPTRARTVLYVGRLAREKGVHVLLKAFARSVRASHPDWSLRIVGPHAVSQGGDGEAYLAELSRLAEPLGEACKFIGPIFDEAALIQELKTASIFIYPSLAESGEAFGLAALEAMAAGCARQLSRSCAALMILSRTTSVGLNSTTEARTRRMRLEIKFRV